MVSKSLCENLSRLGKVEVVVDAPPPDTSSFKCIWIPDEDTQGYEHLMSHSKNFPLITSWSRAFVHLSRTLRKGEAIWFVEDDVASDFESFRQLVIESVKVGADLSALELESATENPGWIWFPTADGFFKRPWRSFNPLCRLSENLIQKILKFREHHGRMTFHEVLFASVAEENGMVTLDWKEDFRFKHLVANFKYRPIIVSPVQGVCHPVKDLKLVNLLCEAPAPEFPRMSLAKLSGYGILSEDYVFLSRFSRKMKLKNVVEFGPGGSTLAFRDAGCKVTSYEHELKWLEQASQLIGDDSEVNLCLCGRGDLPDDEELDEVVDLVFVDGPTQIEGDEMARLRICEWAMSKHGIFLLNDAKRETETAILEVFKERGFEALEIPTRKGMVFVSDSQRCVKFVELALAVTSWPRGECLAWEILVKNSQPIKALLLGGNEEEQMIAVVKGLFTHPESSFHHVVKPDGDPSLDSPGDGVEIYEGESVEILSWMIATEGHWESFDFVLIDQEISPFELLSQACQVWPLLKIGGMLGFSGISHHESVTEDGSTIDDLIKSLGEQVQVVLKGKTCVLVKLRG